MTLPFGGFEHFVSILVGCPDPDDLRYDFVLYASGTNEADAIRSSVRRLRVRFMKSFRDEQDGELARNIIYNPVREKTYRVHPGLWVRTDPSVQEIDQDIVRSSILAKLLERFPPGETRPVSSPS
ncbi:MAG: hypothetical protein K2V38_26220 [Gemmataceae bacterium]|nr:hypothetical protein [Gemmataceae bacterium]